MRQTLRSKFLQLRLGVCLALLFGSAFSHAAPCEALQDWRLARTELEKSAGKGLRVTSEAQKNEWTARTRSAKRLVESYFEGQANSAENMDEVFGNCLEGLPDRQNFLNTLQMEIIEESLARLRQAHSPIIQDLLKTYDQKIGSHGAMLFRLVGHYSQVDAPTDEKAGFHRGSGSIFMNLSRTSHQEWLLILVHELLHSVDPMLSESIRAYSQPELLLRLGEASRTMSSPEQLNSTDRAALEQWIRAGLGRGLWAEYRAWVVTLAAYREGLSEGLWPKIDWVERVLSEQSRGESLEAFTYRYLDGRSQDPRDGIFSRPLIQRALFEVRERARRGDLSEIGGLRGPQGKFRPGP